MGTVLEFRNQVREVKPVAERRRRRPRGAVILIFPGVRYEYWCEREPSAAAEPPPIERDTLELLD